jgi:DNA adenine methylase
MATRVALQLALNGEVTKGTNGKYPCPFVKWAGGKRFLLGELCRNLPGELRNPDVFKGDYYEPFVGGGALFFALHKKLKKAYLSDSNHDLVITYRAIQENPYELIHLLEEHSRNNSKSYYLGIRQQEPVEPLEIAARFIYLNKTCYNGLYRVNRQGKFNVPYGTYKNPNIVDEKNILACHEALKCAKIEYKDFKAIKPRKGDFVYFDPPYHPTDVISFTEYTKTNFTEKDQADLMELARLLHKRGVKVMLSNSDTPFINDLYKGVPFRVQIVQAPRFVNCKADRRNLVREVLITNY